MAKVFTLAEISEHNTTNDCWVTISGKVYNLSSFMDEHPGGDEVLLAATGKDATAEFDDVGHSQDARELMEKYYIGEINKSTIINDEPINPTFEPKVEKKGTKSKYMTYFLQFVVPLIILNLIVAFFSKSSS